MRGDKLATRPAAEVRALTYTYGAVGWAHARLTYCSSYWNASTDFGVGQPAGWLETPADGRRRDRVSVMDHWTKRAFSIGSSDPGIQQQLAAVRHVVDERGTPALCLCAHSGSFAGRHARASSALSFPASELGNIGWRALVVVVTTDHRAGTAALCHRRRPERARSPERTGHTGPQPRDVWCSGTCQVYDPELVPVPGGWHMQ